MSARNILKRILSIKNDSTPGSPNVFRRIWYGPNSVVSFNSKTKFEEVLTNSFPDANSIKVKDVSGGSGAIYEVYVESPEFLGIPILDQHRVVVDALKDQIKLVHGIRIITKASSLDNDLIFE